MDRSTINGHFQCRKLWMSLPEGPLVTRPETLPPNNCWRSPEDEAPDFVISGAGEDCIRRLQGIGGATQRIKYFWWQNPWVIRHVPVFHITQPLDSMIGINGLLDGYFFRWCPIFPKWDIYQPLKSRIHEEWPRKKTSGLWNRFVDTKNPSKSQCLFVNPQSITKQKNRFVPCAEIGICLRSLCSQFVDQERANGEYICEFRCEASSFYLKKGDAPRFDQPATSLGSLGKMVCQGSTNIMQQIDRMLNNG